MRLSWEVDGRILTEAKEDADGVHLPGAVDEGYDRADELHHERVLVRAVVVCLCFGIERRVLAMALFALGGVFCS